MHSANSSLRGLCNATSAGYKLSNQIQRLIPTDDVKVMTSLNVLGSMYPHAANVAGDIQHPHNLVMNTTQALQALSALAQESRLAIFRLLVEHCPDGLPVGVIGETLGLPSATLSFHLKELHNAGLISSKQSGRFVYYSTVMGSMNCLVAFLTENCCIETGESCVPPVVPQNAGRDNSQLKQEVFKTS